MLYYIYYLNLRKLYVTKRHTLPLSIFKLISRDCKSIESLQYSYIRTPDSNFVSLPREIKTTDLITILITFGTPPITKYVP